MELADFYRGLLSGRRLICSDKTLKAQLDKILSHLFRLAKGTDAEFEIYKYESLGVINDVRSQ